MQKCNVQNTEEGLHDTPNINDFFFLVNNNINDLFGHIKKIEEKNR